MLTLDVMNEIELTPVPIMQKAVGWILRANYRLPPTRTTIRIEGWHNLPDDDRPVYLAMNHTDRYNYWPFQVHLWREHDVYTATWVKGKYYNSTILQKFMVWTNNIPTPSRGYVLTADAAPIVGPPDSGLYRLLRDAIEENVDDDTLQERAQEAGKGSEVQALIQTSRSMLGLPYSPGKHTYVERQREVFRKMMDAFVQLNYDAFDQGLRILVFPEGTRSLTLSEGKTGLAQMALRTKAAIVPIGCNGSDEAYPSNAPFSSGGDIVYRIGEPLRPDVELADYQIAESYRPFTDEADAHEDTFRAVTDLVMDRIADLLDARYLKGEGTAVSGASRFL